MLGLCLHLYAGVRTDALTIPPLLVTHQCLRLDCYAYFISIFSGFRFTSSRFQSYLITWTMSTLLRPRRYQRSRITRRLRLLVWPVVLEPSISKLIAEAHVGRLRSTRHVFWIIWTLDGIVRCSQTVQIRLLSIFGGLVGYRYRCVGERWALMRRRRSITLKNVSGFDLLMEWYAQGMVYLFRLLRPHWKVDVAFEYCWMGHDCLGDLMDGFNLLKDTDAL